jgi:hypothetical protein
MVLAVAVHDDGTLDVFANGADEEPTSCYSAADVYGAFGMSPPTVDAPGP